MIPSFRYAATFASVSLALYSFDRRDQHECIVSDSEKIDMQIIDEACERMPKSNVKNAS